MSIIIAMMLSGCASWTYYQQRTVLLQGDALTAPDVLMTCFLRNIPPALVVRASTPLSDGGSLRFSTGSQVDIERAPAGSAYTILGGPRKAGNAIQGALEQCAVNAGRPLTYQSSPSTVA
ncbi:hypothetical protein AL485_16055 [Serratia liquefaciens]|nr:hypothetical protein AL485_16055 [Serratia liquefaciens]